jgi:hypothetical protein
LFSQTQPKSLPTAKELLEMELDKTYPIIENLTKEESKELISQIRKEVKSEFKQADQFYFLISHLEEIQAIEKEQARLRSLLWVFGLGFLLFFSFLTYIFFSQRRAIRDINQMLEK